MGTTKSYNEYLKESLKDPEEAAAYLNAALEEEDLQVFTLALRDVVESTGGIGPVARKSHLNRENLYKMLSEKGNPRLQSLNSLMNTLGFQLHVVVHKKPETFDNSHLLH